jgi:hypothetical protein
MTIFATVRRQFGPNGYPGTLGVCGPLVAYGAVGRIGQESGCGQVRGCQAAKGRHHNPLNGIYSSLDARKNLNLAFPVFG